MRTMIVVLTLLMLIGCAAVPADITTKQQRLEANLTYLDQQFGDLLAGGEFTHLDAQLPGGEEHVCLKEDGLEKQVLKHRMHLKLLMGASKALSASLTDWCAENDDSEETSKRAE